MSPIERVSEPATSDETSARSSARTSSLEPIGEGGMGVVYLAEQTQPGAPQGGLKIIKPGMDTKQVIARFEAERQALALMDHPNIARVLDAGATESGRPYFVMELVRGIPITEYCDQERLSIRRAAGAVRARLPGRAARPPEGDHPPRPQAFQRPGDACIDGVAVPKIIDFGVAKATGRPLTERTLFTGFHQLIGTPLYMSPEQAELARLDVDTRSDIYSLGVLLYELLTGTTPFDSEHVPHGRLRRGLPNHSRAGAAPAEHRDSARSATRRSPSPPTAQTDPRKLDRSLRGELDWIVMKCLEKDRVAAVRDSQRPGGRPHALPGRPARRGLPAVSMVPPHEVRPAQPYGAGCGDGCRITLLAGATISIWQAIRATRAEARAVARAEESGRVLEFLVEDVFGMPARKRHQAARLLSRGS